MRRRKLRDATDKHVDADTETRMQTQHTDETRDAKRVQTQEKRNYNDLRSSKGRSLGIGTRTEGHSVQCVSGECVLSHSQLWVRFKCRLKRLHLPVHSQWHERQRHILTPPPPPPPPPPLHHSEDTQPSHTILGVTSSLRRSAADTAAPPAPAPAPAPAPEELME